MENWESEFLQMGIFVILMAFLYQSMRLISRLERLSCATNPRYSGCGELALTSSGFLTGGRLIFIFP